MKNFSLYTIIIAVCLLLLLNPFVGYWLTASRGFSFFYMTILDLILIAISIAAFVYIKFRKKYFFYLMIALILLSTPAMIAAEAVYIHLRFTKLSQDNGGDVIERDPLLGFKLKTSVSERHWSPEFDALYVIDGDGRRQSEMNSEAQQTIHVFGDSFTFGFGVNNHETWPSVLNKHLNNSINIINYAVIGYGLEQMYLSFEQNSDQIKHNDIVLFAPISDDLQRNLVAKTHVCMTPVMEPDGEHYFPIYDDGVWRAMSVKGECNYFWDSLLGNSLWPISLGGLYRSWRLRSIKHDLIDNAERIFHDAQSIADRKGAQFQIVFLSTPEECVTRQHAIDLSSLQAPSRSLLDYCPDSLDEARSLRFDHDRHYSVEGHKWAANAMHEVLFELEPGYF